MPNTLLTRLLGMRESKMRTERLCETCQKEQIWEHLMGKRKPGSVKDFPIGDILARQVCPFCKLLHGMLSVTPHPSDNIYTSGTVCQLRTLPGNPPGVTVSFGDEFEMIRIRVEKKHLVEGTSRSAASHDFAGPPIDFSRLREILTACLGNHERCRFKPLSGGYRKKSNILLIDVYQYRLVEKAYDCERVALSYVWGKDQALKTTSENLAEFKEEGSLLKKQNEIPKTIWDSVLLVRKIGQRYL